MLLNSMNSFRLSVCGWSPSYPLAPLHLHIFMRVILSRILHIANTALLRPLYEFVYPPICFVCSLPLQSGERRLCASCWSALKLADPHNDVYQESLFRLRSTRFVEDLAVLYLFEKEGIIQSLLHQLKYSGMTSIGVELGIKLGERICSTIGGTDADALLPVPLHKAKERERGYNQSEYICRGISSVTNIPVLSCLLWRTKYTKSQTQLTSDQRTANVRDAFAVAKRKRPLVSGRRFLLVDDVITTGSTVVECARVLKEYGAREVIACSLALADRPDLP